MYSDDKMQKRETLREKIDVIDQKMNMQNSKLKKINIAQSHLSKVKENIDKCSEMLANALEDGYEKKKFENLVLQGKTEFTKTYGRFEEQADVLRQNISNLRDERASVVRQYEENFSDKKND